MHYNEEQIMTSYLIDGTIGCAGGERVRKFSMVCLQNNGYTFVARGILVTLLQSGTPEPQLGAIYIVLFEPH